MKPLYRLIKPLRRFYWYIFRPKTSGAKCLVRYGEKYLLIQTSYSGAYWTLPGGGIRRGESPEHAAKREVREELGIEIADIKPLGKYESSVEYKRDTVHLFVADVEQENFKPNAEVSAAGWFPEDQLPDQRSKALDKSLALLPF